MVQIFSINAQTISDTLTFDERYRDFGQSLTLNPGGTYYFSYWDHEGNGIEDQGVFKINRNKISLFSKSEICDENNPNGVVVDWVGNRTKKEQEKRCKLIFEGEIFIIEGIFDAVKFKHKGQDKHWSVLHRRNKK